MNDANDADESRSDRGQDSQSIMETFDEIPDLVSNLFYNITNSLYNKMFKSYLKLGDYQKAYLIAFENSDTNERNTCMRYFIMYLCDNNKLETLTNFPYHGCLFDVYMTIISKARSSNLYDNSGNVYNNSLTCVKYYEIAISLLVKRLHYFEAA